MPSRYAESTQVPSDRSRAEIGEWLTPQLDAVYARDELPALLPGGSGA